MTASRSDIADALREANAHLEVTRARLLQAAEALDALIDGSTALGLELLAERLMELRARLSDLLGDTDQARNTAAAMAQIADAARPATASRRAVTPRSSVPRPTGAGWTQDRPPAHVKKAAERFSERSEGVSRPTTGVLWSSTSTSTGAPLESGGRDRALAADLIHDPLRGPPVTFYQHVEAKVAARMRRDGVREAELVIDNTVCGSTDRDAAQPWACHAILPSMLPAGSRLTVWITRDAGRTWWRTTYHGTGERIR